MKTTVEKLDPTRAKLNVEVPFVELKPSVDKALKNISEQVNIPGFRKGKVPTRLIEERFGRPMIMQEAVNEALPELYRQAVTEAGIRPLGQPDVSVEAVPGLESADDESDLKFTVEVDVRPDIELPEFSGYEVEIEEPEVGESAVEERLEALRERFGTLVGVDRPAAEKDFVSIDLVATIGDEEIETAEGVSYRIGEGNMLEGLDEALT
ncbi:trigger factor, partial [Dermabacteraceae bacterium P13101]